jgi:2-aminoadipate transaminase
MQTHWDNRYAQRTQRMKSSAIRELLKLTELPDVISFAGGLPAPEVFPVKEFQQACQKVLQEQGSRALQYGPTEGYLPLRELIAQMTSCQSLQVTPDNILITSGSQQALDMLGRIFINPGDHIIVESPTYLGALQAWSMYGAEYVPVPSDQDGIQTDQLEEAFRAGPKAIYVIPNFHNPTGVTIPFERRQRLIEVAGHFGVPIIEDDPYGKLRFEGDEIPSLLEMDQSAKPQLGQQIYDGNIIQLGTFSKTMAPGMRLAWVTAPAEVIRKLVMAKQGADLQTATFNQIVAYEVARDGFLDQHIELIRKVYRERRDVMLESLEEHMPAGVRWTHPRGGLFLWVTLPETINTVRIFQQAVEQKVAFVPGDSFYPCGGGENTMRLNFSNARPEMINEGIARLGRVIRTVLKSL